MFPAGAFTLSLDLELVWGSRDRCAGDPARLAALERRAVAAREHVIPALLALLERHGISATWATVGSLFLEDGERAMAGWLEGLPRAHPAYFARPLVETIARCATPQEIGSHAFTHAVFGTPGCSRQTADWELGSSVAAARALGLELRSLVFPRNSVGHLDVVARHGFVCYRGVDESWWNRLPGRARQAAHLGAVLAAAPPEAVLPRREPGGLVNVPGSMLFFPADGWRRHLPMERRVRRALAGVAAAARERRLFHLWFHPENLVDAPERMLAGLDTVFAAVRAHGLEVLTMAQAAGRA